MFYVFFNTNQKSHFKREMNRRIKTLDRMMRRTPQPVSGSACLTPPAPTPPLSSPPDPHAIIHGGLESSYFCGTGSQATDFSFFLKSASGIKGCSFLAKLLGAMTALLFLISLRSTASCLR